MNNQKIEKMGTQYQEAKNSSSKEMAKKRLTDIPEIEALWKDIENLKKRVQGLVKRNQFLEDRNKVLEEEVARYKKECERYSVLHSQKLDELFAKDAQDE